MIDQCAPPSINHRVLSFESIAWRRLLPLFALRGSAAFISAPLWRFPDTFSRHSESTRWRNFVRSRHVSRDKSKGFGLSFSVADEM